MPSLVVVGLQFGDEGKGRVVHSLARHAHSVVRYQGGNNAGHTLVLENKSILALHLVPSGIVYPKVQCLIGNGVVVDPQALYEETRELNKRGIKTSRRLWVSGLCHVILPYHLKLERFLEARSPIGTTQRGIGPAYKDKIARIGIRIVDYLDEELMPRLVAFNIREKLSSLASPLEIKKIEMEILADYPRLKKFLLEHVADVSLKVHEDIQKNRKVLFESAQGTFLDVDFGTYPYVTSSNPVAGSVPSGVGIGPKKIDAVLGVAKLFTTRVGEGPLPTEIHGSLADEIREVGLEYGATTGRPRRIGHLDLALLKKAVRINGVDRLALTKLDTLSGLKTMRVCVGYKWRGKVLKEFPDGRAAQAEAEPIYKILPGFSEDLTNVRRYQDLPKSAKRLIELVTDFVEARPTIVSVGRSADQQVILDKQFLKPWL